MGKSVKERLDETIKRDKQEIAEEDNKMEIKGNKETNVEDFVNPFVTKISDAPAPTIFVPKKPNIIV